MRRALLIYNPVAGRYPSWLLTERAARVLRKEGWKIEIETTQDGEHITQLARQAGQEKLEALFVAGGDGSLNRAVRGLVGTETALGVLPAGTANVFGQELGLPGLGFTRLMALEESANRLAHARVYRVDIGLCDNIPFLLWAGVGLDGFVIHRIEPRSQWEKHFATVQYTASVFWNARRWHGMDLHVRTNGSEISGRFVLAVVSNIHLYAGGLANLSPDARIDDGRMDLWLFEGEKLEDTLQQAWDLLSGRHVQSERVKRVPFSQISLESDAPLYIQIDGEPELGDRQINIEVIRHGLSVLDPANKPRSLF
jgi:YegS/Rv2252/BmrU family lipid kinase